MCLRPNHIAVPMKEHMILEIEKFLMIFFILTKTHHKIIGLFIVISLVFICFFYLFTNYTNIHLLSELPCIKGHRLTQITSQGYMNIRHFNDN